MTGRLTIGCLLLSLNVAAQEPVAIDSLGLQVHATTWKGRLQQVQQYLDLKAKSKVDPNYIEVPEKPWRVILRCKETGVDVEYDNSLVDPEEGCKNRFDWNLHFAPPVSASVGFWVGYRGTGVTFSKSLVKNKGRYFSFSTTGANYGFNFRLRRFNTDETTLTTKLYEGGEMVSEKDQTGKLRAPVWIRSTYINGYYVFNGRRYSQAAAYNQSVCQRRSAGSFLVGATWYQSSFDYSDVKNASMLILGNNVNCIKLHQASIGLGYGYNLVPFKGLVVNAMAMPTLSVYNRVKVYKYNSNYTLLGGDGNETDDYGKWDAQKRLWANGKVQKPLTLVDDASWLNDVDFWDGDPETDYGALRFNLDLRLGIAYNWKNYFIGFQAQLNNFNYKKGQCKVNLFDAYARAALGVRL